MNQNLCFEYQQLMSRYNITDKHRQLELKKNDSQHHQLQIKKEKLSKEFKNNKLKVEVPTLPTQQHHILNFSKLFKNIKPAPVAPVAEAVAEPVAEPVAEAVAEPVAEAVAEPVAEPVEVAAMKNKILFKALQQIIFKK